MRATQTLVRPRAITKPQSFVYGLLQILYWRQQGLHQAEMAARRGGLTAEQCRWKLIREWCKERAFTKFFIVVAALLSVPEAEAGSSRGVTNPGAKYVPYASGAPRTNPGGKYAIGAVAQSSTPIPVASTSIPDGRSGMA
jgi:hypothetical protein